MTSADYDYEYFRKFLLQKKNFEYEKYKDYDVRDFMIECLNDETIYDYYSLDGNMFYYYFFYPNRSEPWEDEICPGQPFDDFSNLFISPEVRLKVLLFIQQNAEKKWPHTNYSLIQDECARIICGILNELKTSDYQDMPKPDFENLIRDPKFLTEKTPSRRWCEEHNLDTSAIPAIKSHDQDDVEDVHSSSDKLEKIASTLTPIEDVLKIDKVPSANPYPFVINTNKAEEIIGLLTDYMKGIDLSKPKKLMMPVRAAFDAGVIDKPTYTEFMQALPDFLPKQSSSFNWYLRTDIPHPYEKIQAYTKMKEAFEALLA